MKRRVILCWFCMGLLMWVGTFSGVSAEEPSRQKAQKGMGSSLMGLQEGVRGMVTGFFGVGEHAAKFLFYGARDGLRAMGRGAKKANSKIEKSLW